MISINIENKPNSGSQSSIADSPSSATTITLAHLSDPHISCMDAITTRDLFNKRLPGYLKWKLYRRSGHSDNVLPVLQADLAATKPDHIVVTGDLTHLSLSTEFKKARQWLQTLGSPSKVTVIPGNHDAYVHTDWHKTMVHWTEYMLSDINQGAKHLTNNINHIFPCLRIRDHVAIIGVCTAQPTALHLAVGSIGTGQLGRLEKILSQTAGQEYFRVLLIHHPPIPGTVSWRKRLTDAPALQSLLAHYDVELILHGHTHFAHQCNLKTLSGNVPVMGAPSITALNNAADRRARYYIYRISPMDNNWNVRLQVRVYSPSESRFKKESEQQISDHQQSWGYGDVPSKGPGPRSAGGR
jgi:predicted MPP superfamily phosphohydrolase